MGGYRLQNFLLDVANMLSERGHKSAQRTNENSPPIHRWVGANNENHSPCRTTEEGVSMSHAFVSNLMHCTFSTKERYPFIDSELEARLWPYVGGIANENRMKALALY